MFERHPTADRLASFGRAKLSRQQNREVVRHLLTGCERCARALAAHALPGLGGAPGPRPGDYDAAFAKARQSFLWSQQEHLDEQQNALALLQALESHPFDRQVLLLMNSRRFWTWPLCCLLLDRCHELGFKDPGRALDFARLGVRLSEQLSVEAYGDRRIADLKARTWAALANAQRIDADFRAAEQSFLRSERSLRKGTGDPLEKARVLLLKASLSSDQRRFPEAIKLLDRVLVIARRNGDEPLVGKALIKKGIVYGISGRTDEAIDCLRLGVRGVDPKSEPRLVVAARHNLIVYLIEGGQLQEAVTLLDATRPLYEEMGDRMNLIRLQWLEGKIAQSRGRLSDAEALFRSVGAALAEQGLGYDAALLALDLAGVYARQGRTEEMRALAAEMLPSFQARQVHREALAALIVFQKAAQMDRVTLGLVQELSDYLRQCRKNPGVRFRDSI
ncbi:MAG TPA: tetratricopeptide repeat protein [Thermoanaerobaculia bacterium]|jgi:tetratricopeptide (TPR) repeat protein|nr:tetratricopeptide repeat protein [Thermoanaerobaculia bacterium]